jgi:hypothetical protein
MSQKKSGIVFNPKKRYFSEKPSNTIDSHEDFPELEFMKPPTVSESNSELDYKQITEESEKSENKLSDKKYVQGWTYGTINPKTNTSQWKDFSDPNSATHLLLYDSDYLEQFLNRHEIEKENFMEEYGYEETKRYYGFVNSDDSEQEEGSDMEDNINNDDYFEYSEEEY